jgi:hypothetical protein
MEPEILKTFDLGVLVSSSHVCALCALCASLTLFIHNHYPLLVFLVFLVHENKSGYLLSLSRGDRAHRAHKAQTQMLHPEKILEKQNWVAFGPTKHRTGRTQRI